MTGGYGLWYFDFFGAFGFFPCVPATDVLQHYAMAGGVSLYLRQFDPTISLEENVCEAFLSLESMLYDEPTNLIKQEVQKDAPFNVVIQVIAEGRSQNNEIATAVGIQTSELTYYLKELRSGLVHAQADSWPYAFLKSGFTRGAVEMAASHGRTPLVTFDSMCGGGAL